MMNAIEQAVEPLKQQAIDLAEQQAEKTIAIVSKELAAANNDLQICAPYPKAWATTNYHVAVAKYRTFRMLATTRKGSHYVNEPVLADMDSEKIAQFIKDAKEQAAESFNAYVAKLNAKIGPVQAARLSETQALWSYSFLHVVLPSGETQIWKTQIICNVSKLGKVFNQFPTRKVKKEQ